MGKRCNSCGHLLSIHGKSGCERCPCLRYTAATGESMQSMPPKKRD
jgi:hypothetical protein